VERSGAERGTGKEEMSREHTTMFSCLTYHLHVAERCEERGKKKRPGNIQQCSFTERNGEIGRFS
jgi:hypothetical protein